MDFQILIKILESFAHLLLALAHLWESLHK